MAAFECKYSYKVPGLQKAPAEVTGKVFEELANSEKGLSPRTLVDASRDVDAPLHNEFEWRDDVAAEKYRLTQAQGIITNLRIVTIQADGGKALDRAFVVKPGGESQYVFIQNALSREDWKDHLIEEARRECKAFLGKYRRIKALAGITDAMEAFLHSDVG